MLAIVVIAKTDRMPRTTYTTTVWTRATAPEPSRFSAVMAAMTATEKTLIHTSLPSATAELA